MSERILSPVIADTADDPGDLIPDRLRGALVAVLRACVQDDRRFLIAVETLGLNDDGERATLSDIGHSLDISPERVRQLRNSAFQKIAANIARRPESAQRLRNVLGDISTEIDWQVPGATAEEIAKWISSQVGVLEQLTFICCRAAGSAANARQLRQDSAAAAHTAWDKRAREDLWRSDRWEEVLGKVIFRQVTYFAAPPEELVGMKRQPNERVTASHFESARLRRAVYYESPTELRVFRWLERSPSVRWYQEQPVRVLYAYRGLLKPYFPDAAVMGEDGRVMVVEVKPSFEMYRDITLAKATGALQHFGSRGIGFLMVDSSGQTLHDIAQHPFSPAVAEAIEALFGPRPVRFGQVRRKLEALMGRFDQKVFASMVVNRDWAVTRAPGVLVSRLPPELSFRVLLAGAAG